MIVTDTTSPAGMAALLVFVGCAPLACCGWLVRTLRVFRGV